jgi:hypothetical protein
VLELLDHPRPQQLGSALPGIKFVKNQANNGQGSLDDYPGFYDETF